MKEIILGIVFIIGAVSFILAAVYFKSEKYLNALCDGIYDEKQKKAKILFGKATSWFSMAIGCLTLVSGILFFVFPEMKYSIALFYIIVFSIMVMVYMTVFCKKTK